jgi:hypothetical protein
MTAPIIQFRDYQVPRDLAPMHGDIKKSGKTKPYNG